MRRLPKVAGEMALHVLAYNITRGMQILDVCGLMPPSWPDLDQALADCLVKRNAPKSN
jgi:hypothetical protein